MFGQAIENAVDNVKDFAGENFDSDNNLNAAELLEDFQEIQPKTEGNAQNSDDSLDLGNIWDTDSIDSNALAVSVLMETHQSVQEDMQSSREQKEEFFGTKIANKQEKQERLAEKQEAERAAAWTNLGVAAVGGVVGAVGAVAGATVAATGVAGGLEAIGVSGAFENSLQRSFPSFLETADESKLEERKSEVNESMADRSAEGAKETVDHSRKFFKQVLKKIEEAMQQETDGVRAVTRA